MQDDRYLSVPKKGWQFYDVNSNHPSFHRSYDPNN